MDEQDIKKLIADIRAGFGNSQTIIARAKAEKDVLKALEKVNDELKKYLKTTKDLNDEDKKQLNEMIDLTEKEIDQRKKNLQLQERIQRSTDRLRNSFMGLGDASVTGAEKISYYTSAFKDFPIFGRAIDELGKSVEFNLDTFKTLSSVGADFGGTFIALRLQARDALLPLNEFVDLIGQNSQGIARLFGSVNQGTQSVAELTREIRSQLLPQFAGLGITTENMNEFLGTFFELQRIQGRRDYLTTQDSIDSLESYTRSLDAVAKLTGIQRDNLDKLVKQQRSDSVFQSYLQGLDKSRANELSTFIAGLQGMNPALGEAVKNILSTGFPLGEFERMLVGTTDGLLDNILALREGNINVAQFANALAGSANTFNTRFGPAVLRTQGTIGEVGNALLSFKGKFADLDEITKQQLTGAQGLGRELILTQESFRQFKSAIEGFSTTALQTFGAGFPALLSGINQTTKVSAQALIAFQKSFPEMAAGIAVFGAAAQFIYPEAKQIAIIAAGTAAGNMKLGGFIKDTARVLGAGLRPLATIAAGITAVGLAASNIGVLADPNASSQDKSKAGTKLAAQVGGALIGRQIGMAAGAFGGPLGMALGAIAGNYVGGILGEMFSEKRAYGGGLMAGQTALVGERGPELFQPNQAGRIEPMLVKKSATGVDVAQVGQTGSEMTATMSKYMADTTNAYKAFADASAKMEKHLNTLVSISAKNEKNTGVAMRKLDKLPNLA